METIEEIKHKIDIVDYIGAYVALKKSGKNHTGLCPFHSEKTPSFMVSSELQIYKCFGCGAGGDIYSFVQRFDGVDFYSALKLLADKAGVELTHEGYSPNVEKLRSIYKLNQLAMNFYHYLLTKHKFGVKGLEYLHKTRQLSDACIKEFQLGYAPASWDILYKTFTKKGFKDEDLLAAGLIIPRVSGAGYRDKFVDRIIFPFIDVSNKVVGFTGRVLDPTKMPKYLNTAETEVFHKSTFIYGLHKAKTAIKTKGVVLVEGQTDVISSWNFGFDNVVGCSGTSLTQGHLNLLARYTKDIIFCFDADTAGQVATKRAIEMAEHSGFNIRVAFIPNGAKDLDEALKKDTDSVAKALQAAVPVYDFYLFSCLKKFDKRDPLGKKHIIEELHSVFSKISDKILFDHYVTALSRELDISKETIDSVLRTNNSVTLSSTLGNLGKSTKISSVPISDGSTDRGSLPPTSLTNFAQNKHSPEFYMLALLFKAPLDLAQTYLYKLGQKDFTSQDILEIFTNLKEYLLGRKRNLNIQHFAERFNQNLQDLVTNLYLWDMPEISENESLLIKELETTFTSMKKETIKRDLLDLSDKIKQAERTNDLEALADYTEKFKQLSEKLI